MNEEVLRRKRPDRAPVGRAFRSGAERSRKPSAPASHRPRATDAWFFRDDLLSPTGDRSRLIKAFLELVKARDHEPLSVTTAARELHVSVRTLQRYCSGEIGFPPGMIVDLARMVRVASEILRTDRSLAKISDAHGFNGPSDMRRWFIRFVGIRPGLYRETSGTGRPCGKNAAGWRKLPIAQAPGMA